MRFIDQLIISPTDVYEIFDVVDSLRDALREGNAASVASQEPVHSMANLIVLHPRVPERDRRVFRDMDKALGWLDITFPDAYNPSS